jgi:hypothetical protein
MGVARLSFILIATASPDSRGSTATTRMAARNPERIGDGARRTHVDQGGALLDQLVGLRRSATLLEQEIEDHGCSLSGSRDHRRSNESDDGDDHHGGQGPP